MKTKKYYKFGIYAGFQIETEKAYGVIYAGGCTTMNDEVIYFPKSQITISEPNEVGNKIAYIPKWLFITKTIEPNRLRDLSFHGEVEF